MTGAYGLARTMAFLATGLTACSGGNVGLRPPASLEEPIILERVRTVIRQDTTEGTTWLNLPGGLQYDSIRDHLFAMEYGDARIVQFSTDGEFLGYYGSRGDGPGEIRSLGDFGFGADHVTLLDRGAGKLVVFDRASRVTRLEIRLDRSIGDMAAIDDTLLAVIPGPEGSVFEVFHTDGRSLGSFGDRDALNATARPFHTITDIGGGRLVLLDGDVPEGWILGLDGTVIAAFSFEELAQVLDEWRRDFLEVMGAPASLVRGGTPVGGGKIWLSSLGPAGDGSFFAIATPEYLHVNRFELWVLDDRGRMVDRYVFDRPWIGADSASFPTIYALGHGDEFGVYEYRIPQPADPR